MTRPSNVPSNIAVIITAALAAAVSFPWGRAIAASWMPAADFAIGAALVTLAFLEVARAASAWLARSASLAWIAAALTVGLGLFVAGSAQLLNAHAPRFDWVALGGLALTIVGVQWQRQCALR